MAVSWEYITLMVDHGYFGSRRIQISCSSDAQLHFEDVQSDRNKNISGISDTSQSLDDEELNELDHCVKKFLAKEAVENDAKITVLDGGSFELSVKQKDGGIWKLSCYHAFEQPDLDRALTKMRRLLKEDYFLEKYEEELRRF